MSLRDSNYYYTQEIHKDSARNKVLYVGLITLVSHILGLLSMNPFYYSTHSRHPLHSPHRQAIPSSPTAGNNPRPLGMIRMLDPDRDRFPATLIRANPHWLPPTLLQETTFIQAPYAWI